jgi:hypothetical protein
MLITRYTKPLKPLQFVKNGMFVAMSHASPAPCATAMHWQTRTTDAPSVFSILEDAMPVTPEPSSLALIALALGILIAFLRSR